MNTVPADPQKVQRIMQASMKLFAERGFTHTKTEDIADRAGVSKGLIFHYYRNKAGLFLDTYRHALNVIWEQYSPEMFAEVQDLGEIIARGAEFDIQLQLRFPDEIGFLITAVREMPNLPSTLRRTLNDQYNLDLFNGIRQVFDPAIDSLALRDGVTRDDVRELIITVIEAISKRNTEIIIQDPSKRRIEDFRPEIEHARRLVEILEHGFRAG